MIEIRGLRKAYGGRTVLDGVDLDVASGAVFALLGSNGAGKTTSVGVMTTLVRPDAGTVRVAGLDVVREADRVRHAIALTGQSATVDERLSGAENLVMFARLRGLPPRAAHDRADELLQRFDLTAAAKLRADTYSGGMRRRLDLALSVVTTPEVLFLDEPTTGLDARSRLELWDVIRTMSAGGTTVFLTTQYLEEADRLADRIAVLHGGRIAAEGTAAELKALVGTETVEISDAAGTIVRTVTTDGSAAAMRDALAEVPDSLTVAIRKPTLDDVFLTITEEVAP